MAAENLAQDVYAEAVERLRAFDENPFFLDNPEFTDLAGAYGQIVKFLTDRPAMLVDDATKPAKLRGFSFGEMAEAVEAENGEVETEDHVLAYFKELGDCGFFGLLVGGLFWDTLESADKKIVVASLIWAREKAESRGINFNEAIVYVTDVKNTANYRKELHQLIPGESVEDVRERVPKIRTLHRDLREELNGEWAESKDLLNTLAHYCLDNLRSNDPKIVQKVAQMFDLTGLDPKKYMGT